MMRRAVLLLLVVLAPSLAQARWPEPPGTRQTVFITPGWLARHGPSPYLLNQSDTTYILATDVRTDGSAFVIDAANVLFDLAGHTIRYGDSKPIEVRNGGFEAGSGNRVPGWGLRHSPAAVLAANTKHLFGKQVLRLANFRARQKIVSDPIAVPGTSHTHLACVTPAQGHYRTLLRLSVVDARTGRLLGQGQSPNVERGFSAVAVFRPGASRSIRLLIEATPPAGVADTLDLDEARVMASGDYGILATNAWTGEVPGWPNIARRIGRLSRRARNVTIRNGAVLQGAAHGHGSSPLYLAHLAGVAVERLRTRAVGMDTVSLNAEHVSDGLLVRNCVLEHDVDNISNRGMLVAALRLVHVNGPTLIEDNRLLAVPQVGILLDLCCHGPAIRIRKNEVRQRAVVLNGYALVIAGSRNFEVADNRFIAENGRGILIDGYRKEAVEDGKIRGNYVEVRERTNREYHTRIEARALRLRSCGDNLGPHRNLLIAGNTFVAVTGPGLAQKAFGVRIGYSNGRGQMDRANIRLRHNRIKAIVTSADPGIKAAALVLDGLAARVDVRISDNVLESNDASVALGDSEGSVEGARLVGNTFRKSSEGARRPYSAIHAGYWTAAVRDVAVVGGQLDNGATLALTWSGQGSKDIGLGQLLSVSVTREGRPVARARVVVRDRAGKAVFSGTTDEKGEVRAVPVVVTRYRQRGKDPRRISVEQQGPFEVSVTAGGKAVSRRVTLSRTRSLLFALPAAG
jgi:hypothetical protein